jgi:hypothetical protein
MTQWGFDWAWYRPPSTKWLKDQGCDFVCRYVSPDTTGKNITKAEARSLRKAGVDVVLNYEWTASEALGGTDAGTRAGRLARAQAQAVGYPHGASVYFSVDFDASASQMAAIARYLRGANQALGPYEVGVYGGYETVKAMLDRGACEFAWQTYAWSGGRVDHRAQLYQYLNGAKYDHDRSQHENFGSWVTHKHRAAGAVYPGDRGRQVKRLQRRLNLRRGRRSKRLAVDGIYGPQSQSEARHFKSQHRGLGSHARFGPPAFHELAKAVKRYRRRHPVRYRRRIKKERAS